jgi:hypothetical protein
MLIGLGGCKRVGKDTAAQWLIDEQGYTRLAFADKLKEAVASLFGISIEQVDHFKQEGVHVEIDLPVTSDYINDKLVLSWREFLQRFGTEMGRNTFGQNFWIRQWSDSYTALWVMQPDEAQKVVVTDVRFENEAKEIKLQGGYIIEITRPGYNPDGHASEEPIPSILVDATVRNESNLEDFRTRFLATVEGLTMGIVA